MSGRDKYGRFAKGHTIKCSPEARKRTAEKLRGLKRTPEQNKHNSEAQKRYWSGPLRHNELLRRSKIGASVNSRIKGENHHSWKGGRYIGKDGYVRILKPGHPMTKKDNYILEHRFIMSEHLGRPLLSEEYVHHRNQNKKDNRLENLEIIFMKIHKGQVICPYCGEEFAVR
jgi:hypothetical protein